MKFQPTFRIGTVAAALIAVATLAFAGCGGGGYGGTGAGVGCQGYGGGGGGGNGGNCNAHGASPTPAASAQAVGELLTGENAQTVPTYGQVLGYADGTGMGANRSNVVNLTAGTNVQFVNLETVASGVPHTASSLGAWGGSFPAGGPSAAQGSTATAAGMSIGTAGFSTGTLNPGQLSAVYSSGGAGQVIIFGCFYHYNSNNMRTVVIVM